MLPFTPWAFSPAAPHGHGCFLGCGRSGSRAAVLWPRVPFSGAAAGDDATEQYMEPDHIVPWSKAGKTTPENCQMPCIACNRSKCDLSPQIRLVRPERGSRGEACAEQEHA